MQKRALGDQVMIYILVVVILGAIAVIGWKMVSATSSRFCKTELTDFQLLLGEQSKGLRNGETVEKNMDVPCGADKVYLFDAGNKPAPELFDSPLLKDAVASSAAKNVYIVKGGDVVSSFEVPFLEIPYPYFTCMIPGSGKIQFLLQGLGRGVAVEPSCFEKNCVVVPETYDSAQADAVLYQTGITGTDYVAIKDSAEGISDQITIERMYGQCGGKLHMEILIVPETSISPFNFMEAVPSCIEETETQYENVEGFAYPTTERVLRYQNPSGISSPLTLSYDVKTTLTDACIEEIGGIAYS